MAEGVEIVSAVEQQIRSLHSLARKLVAEFKDESTPQKLRDKLNKALKASERRFFFRESLLAVVQDELRLAGIEKQPAQKSDDMFCDAYLSRVLVTSTGVIHVRDAHWEHLMEFRERQIQNMRRTNAKFEIDEQRRAKLKPLMEGTTKTTEEALRGTLKEAING